MDLTPWVLIEGEVRCYISENTWAASLKLVNCPDSSAFTLSFDNDFYNFLKRSVDDVYWRLWTTKRFVVDEIIIGAVSSTVVDKKVDGDISWN